MKSVKYLVKVTARILSAQCLFSDWGAIPVGGWSLQLPVVQGWLGMSALKPLAAARRELE